MQIFLRKKMKLSVILVIPILMILGGMRVPNAGNMYELRPHIHHCNLSETKHKAVDKKIKISECCHDLEVCSHIVLRNTCLSINYDSDQFTKPYDIAVACIIPPRAPPLHLA